MGLTPSPLSHLAAPSQAITEIAALLDQCLQPEIILEPDLVWPEDCQTHRRLAEYFRLGWQQVFSDGDDGKVLGFACLFLEFFFSTDWPPLTTQILDELHIKTYAHLEAEMQSIDGLQKLARSLSSSHLAMSHAGMFLGYSTYEHRLAAEKLEKIATATEDCGTTEYGVRRALLSITRDSMLASAHDEESNIQAMLRPLVDVALRLEAQFSAEAADRCCSSRYRRRFKLEVEALTSR